MADLIDKGLKAFIKAMKSPPHARVGILQGKTKPRKPAPGSKSTPTNAEIGAAHEFGAPSRGLPQRSFLRMPINDHLQKELGTSQVAFKKAFEAAGKDGSLILFLRKLGQAGEAVVRTAFTNNGYGKWAKLEQSTLSRKTVQDTILVETTQLRESVTSDVVK